MEKVNISWKIWGIVSIVVIGFMFLLLIGSYNAVFQLKESYEELEEYHEDSFYCGEGTTPYCAEENRKVVSCNENTEPACMWPEDYKRYYGL